MPRRRSAVFLWSDRALFVGDRSETAFHAHDAIELCFALDDFGVSYEAESSALSAIGAALVPSNVRHRLSIPGPKVAVLYVEPRSAIGAGLGTLAGTAELHELPRALSSMARPRLLQLFDHDADLARADAVCREVLGALVPDPPRPAIDRRLRRAMVLLADRLDRPPSQADVARAVGLSASRLGHLFSAQVGLPMRRYVLWLRLRAALEQALGGATMAEAAHRAGFSDAAHFTRTCRAMFGLAPTAFAPVDAFFSA